MLSFITLMTAIVVAGIRRFSFNGGAAAAASVGTGLVLAPGPERAPRTGVVEGPPPHPTTAQTACASSTGTIRSNASRAVSTGTYWYDCGGRTTPRLSASGSGSSATNTSPTRMPVPCLRPA